MMTEEQKDSLDTIYWACRITIDKIFQSTERYKHVKHVLLPPPPGVYYYDIEGVRRDFKIPSDVEDWGVMKKFSSSAPYSQSTFLQEGLPDIPDFGKFILIQDQTTINNREQRAVRDLDNDEWDLILDRLEREQIQGLVVNAPNADPPPKHPLITNLVGKMSIHESIALLCQAEGYWGIASCLAVLASQIFQKEQMWVKGPESWLYVNRYIYFAPHQDFSFVFRHLSEEKPIETLNTDMEKIEFLIVRIWNNTLVGPGSVVQTDREHANILINSGQARKFVPNTLEKAIAKPVKRTATRFKNEN
jgi:hypothetical protein